MCEDEHRLTSENQLDRGVITLNGQEVMVEQFRMGMTGILFMAPDGRSGFASKDAGSWTWSLFQSQEEKSLSQTFSCLLNVEFAADALTFQTFGKTNDFFFSFHCHWRLPILLRQPLRLIPIRKLRRPINVNMPI